ncbi:Low temperature viability protein-domain-containing protein [Lineolata rhizophorae]|uniref:Low temperature viability protein-domain-containing protein n=1 Tax=Lineolata rhizophorae TaxID=578093 RepID=A0A6A6NYU7_9PEZI|nr:Low temperature viability protein-domain-containing protein [Lineolata rhizophorae]
MPRRKFIDKRSATTYTLVHRAQNDPLIHDADAPSALFKPAAVQRLDDLAAEFGGRVRANEGEAAEHGVYFDDSAYDYMQHLRDLGGGGGGGGGEVTFVEAAADKQGKGKGKGKGKGVRLEDALRGLGLDDAVSASTSKTRDSALTEDASRAFDYQALQDTPDALAGFRPDMDPRLREVLAALEDEAYVDGGVDEEGMFEELAADEEVDEEEVGLGPAPGTDEVRVEDDDGWETDDTVTPKMKSKFAKLPGAPRSTETPGDTSASEAPALSPFDGPTTSPPSFNTSARPHPSASPSIAPSFTSVSTGSALRRKKRKGARTSTTSYSMTSSSLARTDAQTTYDARYEQYEAAYAAGNEGDPLGHIGEEAYDDDDDDEVSKASVFSQSSECPPLREDFDAVMDEFLAGCGGGGSAKAARANGKGRRGRRGGGQVGLSQLDEIRGGLGPARVKGSTKANGMGIAA